MLLVEPCGVDIIVIYSFELSCFFFWPHEGCQNWGNRTKSVNPCFEIGHPNSLHRAHLGCWKRQKAQCYLATLWCGCAQRATQIDEKRISDRGTFQRITTSEIHGVSATNEKDNWSVKFDAHRITSWSYAAVVHAGTLRILRVCQKVWHTIEAGGNAIHGRSEAQSRIFHRWTGSSLCANGHDMSVSCQDMQTWKTLDLRRNAYFWKTPWRLHWHQWCTVAQVCRSAQRDCHPFRDDSRSTKR